MSVKEEIRKQIIGALAKANFPISTPQALLAAFPQGAATKCQAGNVAMTARRSRETSQGRRLSVPVCGASGGYNPGSRRPLRQFS